MILENKDIYIDYGRTDFWIKKCTVALESNEIKVFDRNGTYTFTNDDIKELKITENGDEEDEDLW